MSKAVRFTIRTKAGSQPVPAATTPGSALSKAINQATQSTRPGAWVVTEYDDDIYRVVRHEGNKLLVTIHTLREHGI